MIQTVTNKSADSPTSIPAFLVVSICVIAPLELLLHRAKSDGNICTGFEVCRYHPSQKDNRRWDRGCRLFVNKTGSFVLCCLDAEKFNECLFNLIFFYDYWIRWFIGKRRVSRRWRQSSGTKYTRSLTSTFWNIPFSNVSSQISILFYSDQTKSLNPRLILRNVFEIFNQRRNIAKITFS